MPSRAACSSCQAAHAPLSWHVHIPTWWVLKHVLRRLRMHACGFGALLGLPQVSVDGNGLLKVTHMLTLGAAPGAGGGRGPRVVEHPSALLESQVGGWGRTGGWQRAAVRVPVLAGAGRACGGLNRGMWMCISFMASRRLHVQLVGFAPAAAPAALLFSEELCLRGGGVHCVPRPAHTNAWIYCVRLG